VAGGRPVSLTFWTQVDQEEIYRKLIDDYTALHPNVRIDLVSSSYQDHFPKLQAALNAGIGPDLFHFHNAFHRELVGFMEPYPEAVFPPRRSNRIFARWDRTASTASCTTSTPDS
jgi:multiple sugar transport system substrate-binding protein